MAIFSLSIKCGVGEMKQFDSEEIVIGEMYFCVYESKVFYLTCGKNEFSDRLLSFYDHNNDELFYAFECSLIYQL